jgi:hypothetical protein
MARSVIGTVNSSEWRQHSGDDLGGYARSNKVNRLCPMQIFTEASKLVEAVEAQVIGEKDSPFPELNLAKRLAWLPAKFLWMGVWEIIRSFTDLRVYALVVFVVVTFIAISSSIPSNVPVLNVNLVFGAVFILSVFSIVFSMPSIYGTSGVLPKNVEFVVTYLNSRGFTNAKEVELLKKSVKQFEDRTRSRVTALKWIVSLIWAGFIYIFIKGVEHSMSNPSAQPTQPDIMSAWLLILLVLTYFCVWGYEAALDKLFRAIEFGCNDFCHHTEPPKENENPVIS